MDQHDGHGQNRFMAKEWSQPVHDKILSAMKSLEGKL